MINTLYVAKIVGLLAFPVLQLQPKSFKELVDYDTYHYSFGFESSGGNLFAHFESSSNPVMKKVYQQRQPSKEAVNCFTTALESNFACIAWRGTADYIAYRNLSLVGRKSPLIAADDDKTLFVPLGFVLQRRSILTASFNRFMNMILISGLESRWTAEDLEELDSEKVKWRQMSNSGFTENKEESLDDLLSLNNLLGVIYMFIIGNVLALFTFAVELHKYFKQTKVLVFGKIKRQVASMMRLS